MCDAVNCIAVAQAQQHEPHSFSLGEIQQQLRERALEQCGIRRQLVVLAGWHRLQQIVFHVGECELIVRRASSKYGSLHVYSEILQQLIQLHPFILARSSPRLRRLLPVLALSIAPPRLQLQPLSVDANVLRAGQTLQQRYSDVAQLVALQLLQLRHIILAAVVDR